MKRENNENFNTMNAGGQADRGFAKRATNDVGKAAQSADQANEDLVGVVSETKGQPARTDRKPIVQSVRSTLGKQGKGEAQKSEATGLIVLDDLKKKLGQANPKVQPKAANMRDFLTHKQPRQSSKKNSRLSRYQTVATIDKEKNSCPTTAKMEEEKDLASKPSPIDYAQQLRDEVFNKIGKVPAARQQSDKENAKKKFILGRSKSGHQIQIQTST